IKNTSSRKKKHLIQSTICGKTKSGRKRWKLKKTAIQVGFESKSSAGQGRSNRAALIIWSGKMKLTSRAFRENEKIPDRYSRRGDNVSPPLAWTQVPAGAKSLALIVDDPDAPSGVFVH